MALSAKEKHRAKLIEYLSNPDNEFCSRTDQAIVVLGFKQQETLYNRFTVDELDEIEREALELRRTRYTRLFAKVDKGLIKKAASGDAQAAKLLFQRFENWSERQRHDITADVATEVNVKFKGPDESKR